MTLLINNVSYNVNNFPQISYKTMGLFIVGLLLFLSLIFILNGKNANSIEIGKMGETKIRETLVKYCTTRNAHILNNVTLSLTNHSTTQIDHILISSRGVFVIEAKNYSGWIFADSNSKFWTQVLFKTKHKFQNPILQNYKHVKAVQKTLDFLDPKFIHNIVIFTGEAKFKTKMPDKVYQLNKLTSAIEQYPDGQLSLNRVQFCVGRLEYMRLALTQKTDVEHQKYLEGLSSLKIFN